MSSLQKLQEKAAKLELQVATTRLIGQLFPGIEGVRKSPGRYHFFEKIIKQYPTLLRTLLENNTARISSEWSKVLKASNTDVRFLHTLCILYWELAQAKYEHQKEAEQEWMISTALWVVLLSSVDFWDYFAQDRWTDEQGDRLSLTGQQQEELLHDSLASILAVHSAYGKQSFAAGNYEQAKLHVRCLDMCREKGKKLQTVLQAYNIACAVRSDEQRLYWVTMQAATVLDEWCVVLVEEAEKETNDADAIKQLPQGIRKNYAGGLRVLEPFIALQLPIVRIMNTGLDWYNDWCYDVYVLKETEQLEKLVNAARLIADRLIPLSVKEHGYAQENQLISKHFLLRGFVQDDPILAKQEYEEALAWNPANTNAVELLEQADSSLFVQSAIEYAKEKQFEKAYSVLEQAEQQIKDKKGIQEARAFVYFIHANALAEEGKFREALARGRQAQQLDPTEEEIQKLIENMEELAPEEDNMRVIERAEEFLKKERFSQAISEASRIPKGSLLFKRACSILSLAHFARGMEAVKADKLEKGEEDLRRSLELNEDDETRQTIKGAISITLNRRAFTLIDGASSREEMLSRVPKAKRLLEEALRLDPSNTSAKENLDMVRKAT